MKHCQHRTENTKHRTQIQTQMQMKKVKIHIKKKNNAINELQQNVIGFMF